MLQEGESQRSVALRLDVSRRAFRNVWERYQGVWLGNLDQEERKPQLLGKTVISVELHVESIP